MTRTHEKVKLPRKLVKGKHARLYGALEGVSEIMAQEDGVGIWLIQILMNKSRSSLDLQ